LALGQPLLENAFKHGVERSLDAVRIEIAARRDGHVLRLCVSNTGSSLTAGCGDGIGLRNVRERLREIYGGNAHLELLSRGGGVCDRSSACASAEGRSRSDLLASLSGAWDWIAERRAPLLGAGLAVLAALIALLVAGLVRHGGAVDCALANVFTWLLELAFLGYGRRYLSFASSLLRWARDASYPIYVLHQTVIVALGYYVVQAAWTPWVKYWLVLGATLLSWVVMYACCVRRVRLLRLAFGMKAAAAAPRKPDRLAAGAA
jgi:hypothetical protein